MNATVSGTTLQVTVCDAENPQSSYTASFNLRSKSEEYYDRGSIAFVTNGDHSFKDISLTATAETGYVEQKMPVYDIMNRNIYDIYGNSGSADDDYGAVFTDNLISVAGQTKLKLKEYLNTDNFEASFSVTKTNGNSLFGGMAFHVQECGFTAGTFGSPGYLLYAHSTASSMDVSIILRNYLTASSYVQETVASVEGLLAAPTDGVYLNIKVQDSTLTFTVADNIDRTRVSDEYSVNLISTGAKAGNYKGGAIALVSNGTHEYADLSVTRTVKDRPYKQVENFSAQADFTLPDATTIQQGLTFYTQSAANVSPGLSGYALNLIRSSSTADNTLVAQLVRYGTNSDGNKAVNLGALSTEPISGFLSSANGAGETVRLHITAIRGRLEYWVQNLTNGKESKKYEISLDSSSTKSSVSYNTLYKSGYIGYFTNIANTELSGLIITELYDCSLSFTEAVGGSLTGNGIYSYGETVTVKAQADSNYYFAGWYKDEELLSGENEYSFTIDEDTVITPVFKQFPIRFAGISEDNGYVAVTLDDRENTEKTGFEITVKKQNGSITADEGTEYIKQQSGDKAPYVIADKVYYCDISNDGIIDTGDMICLRRYILTGFGEVNLSAADVNGDSDIDILDIIRIKRIFSEPLREIEEFDADNTYPFCIDNYLLKDGKEYVELKPYAVVGGITTYGASQYLSFNNGALVRNASSAAHTPFAPVKIACVGDSITQGIGATGWSSGDYSMAYPQQMQEILGDGCDVGNFGKGSSYVYYYEGRTAALWYPNTAEYANSNEFDPDIVIIKLGTNDARVMTGENTSEAWAEQFDELIKHYRSLDSQPDIYVVSSITMQLYNEDLEQKLTEYILPKQRETAESNGCNFIDAYTDLYDFFIGGTGFASDGLHPNDNGYRAMAEYIADKLDTDIYY